jgi:hypothetical protein
MNIEHCVCLSWFFMKGESHGQDGERLRRAPLAGRVQRPAILPWPSGPPVNGRAMELARHSIRQQHCCLTNSACILPARRTRGLSRAQ